jgi:hypothetical protein
MASNCSGPTVGPQPRNATRTHDELDQLDLVRQQPTVLEGVLLDRAPLDAPIFIFRGVSSVAAAISHQGFPGRGWAIFFGVISLIAGLVVLAYPFTSIVTLMLVAGVWLIVLGVAEVIAGITMRRDLSKLEKASPPPVQPGTAAPLA